MLIGAHVSTAGGLVNAHARGVEVGAEAIQVFNQSPRMWRPTRWKDDDVAAFRELMADGPIGAVVIHAVYLINCASKDPAIREKSLSSLVHSLEMGQDIGAVGVVLHPGSTVGEPHDEALARVADLLGRALQDTGSCPLLLEDTAGAGNTLGRTFEELAQLIDDAGGHRRLGLCLDSCHLLASGFDVRTADGLAEVVDRCDEIVGLDRLRCLHVNDSQAPLGANRDRHAPLGDGRAGPPRHRRIPVRAALRGPARAVRGPGHEGKGITAADMKRARELRRNGRRARRRRALGRRARAGRAGRSRHRPRPRWASRRSPGYAVEGLAVAVVGALDRAAALGQRRARHLHAAEPVAGALRRLEGLHVDLRAEHLVHAAHEALAGVLVVVEIEVGATRLDASRGMHHAVAEGQHWRHSCSSRDSATGALSTWRV